MTRQVTQVNARARQDLSGIWRHALAAVDGATVTRAQLLSAPPQGPVYAAAIGKAAAGMTAGALAALGADLRRALVITAPEYAGDPAAFGSAPVAWVWSSHPAPTARSLAAGQALLDFIAAAPAGAHLLFLVSGGASAMVEVLAEGLTLSDLQEINRWLWGSGLPIAAVNRVRKACSRIKGGRLRASLAGRSASALVISDVPGDDPAVIGSGLLAVPRADDLSDLPLPAALRSRLPRNTPMPSVGEVSVAVVANRGMALAAAAQRAAALGYPTSLDTACVTGDVADVATRMVDTLAMGAPGFYAWGGEPTVVLPAHPGRGGRAQSLALQVAAGISGQLVVFAAVCSDGHDAESGAMGALVDGESAALLRARGVDIAAALAAADAGTALAAIGATVAARATGTNVMDLYLAIKSGSPGRR